MLFSIEEAFGGDIEAFIIADYKAEVLERYLENFPPSFRYKIIKARGHGTSSGIQLSRKYIGNNAFALVWSDLYFTKPIDTSEISRNTIGTTIENYCRWSYHNGKIVEEPNTLPEHLGIPGVFFFPEPEKVPIIPENGEFVRFLSESKMKLESQDIKDFREIGSYEAYRNERDARFNSRFFNSLKVVSDKVVKEPRDNRFQHLISDEANWYKFVADKSYSNIPAIFSYNPLTMELIDGHHPFEFDKMQEISKQTKTEVICSIISALDRLHSIGNSDYSLNTSREVYLQKTYDRMNKISGIIPNLDSEFYIVNGKKVSNLLHPEHKDLLLKVFSKLLGMGDQYAVIHGDPTFSNIFIESKTNKPIFIDPRGYFGNLKIFGDPLYDFAKLYYSAIGNYDFFNQGRFSLKINSTEVEVKIQSEGYESTKQVFEDYLKGKMPSIEALHALIWLSLTGYVIDDHDAMLASFFYGLKLFEEVLDEHT